MDDVGTGAKAQAEERGSAATSERLMTIGQLVGQLQPDFPDLSVSKVRYLEDRGLLSPVRTKGRYRKYGTEDARTLRGILAMQRDEYLPLEVIRQRTERGFLGRTEATGSVLSRPSLKLTRDAPVFTLGELCSHAGVTEEFVLTLIEFRLVERFAESGTAFTESDLDTTRICQRLGRFDVEPRHLRVLSSAAERGAALIEQVAAPSLRSTHPDRKEYGVETVEELGSLFSQLMQLLLRRELQRLL